MQYDDATNQIAQIEQQTQQIAQQFQSLGQTLNSKAPNPATGKEWLLDLKQIAINVQSQNQQLLEGIPMYFSDSPPLIKSISALAPAEH